MRVIAGAFGGRRLQAPAGTTTRPTSDRVREALFSALGDVDGARVLDLYAGSGALAIEALSRGAGHAVLVDRDARAAAAIRTNLGALELGRERAELRRRDVGAALLDASRASESYDLVFIDPPYRLADGLSATLATALPALVVPGARIVTESDRRMPLALDVFETVFDRRYGDTAIRIHRA